MKNTDEYNDYIDDIRIRINSDGFQYTFEYYSSFNEIKDKEFHKLRKKYLKSLKEFKKYIYNVVP